MKEEQPGPGHGHLLSPLQLQVRGVRGCGQRLWLCVPGPGQQRDEDHRGKQKPEETQNIEAQREETAEVRAEQRVISGALQIPLNHLVGLWEVGW